MEIAQGYSDFILMPDSNHIDCKDVHHSYIIELCSGRPEGFKK